MAESEDSRVLRINLSLIAVCLFSFPAFAKYSGGMGEPNAPYQIATAEDLMLLGESPEDYDKHFILTADIDLDPNLPGRKVFDKAVIGSGYLKAMGDESFVFQGTPFTGVFDGGGHTIFHLTITVTGERYYLGLFGKLASKAEIRDMGVVDVNIVGSGIHVGGLVGDNEQGIVTHCYSTGMVGGSTNIGGLVGTNEGTLTHSYSTTKVSAISARWLKRSSAGGLVGQNDGYIANCYSAGMVTGNGAVGGLVGRSSSWNVIHCVWDVETSQQSRSNRGIGLSTDEMMDPYMLGLNGFANDPNWVLDADRDYPRLAWEGTAGSIIPEPNIDWLEGRGTSEEPYCVDTAGQLTLIGRASAIWDGHFVLCADINLDPNLPGGEIFQEAVIQTFAGVFDGNDHMISHLTIRGRGTGCLGAFGYLASNSEVKNLGVVDANITGSGAYIGALAGLNWGIVTDCYIIGAVSGNSYDVGGLVGYNMGIVTQCHSEGEIHGGGGLIGYNDSLGNLTQCYSTAIVNGTGGLAAVNSGRIDMSYSTGSVTGTSGVGGLVGINFGSLSGCYSTGTVTSSERVGGLVGINVGEVTACYSSGSVHCTYDHVGGLVGHNESSITTSYSSGSVTGRSNVGGLVGGHYRGDVSYCYSTCAVSGSEWPVGGLVGYKGGSVSQCYSTGTVGGNTYAGGLVGYYYSASVLSEPILTDCFWDIETSGRTWSYGGTGKATVEMQTATTFLNAGWDFVGETATGTEDIWWILEGQDYPRLWWEAK